MKKMQLARVVTHNKVVGKIETSRRGTFHHEQDLKNVLMTLSKLTFPSRNNFL